MSEIDRLYSYRTLLSGRRAVPREEILSRLEISLATFKRDLAKLRDRLQIPVVFDQALGGYRLEKTDARHELPGLWFSQEEVLALLTIQRMIEQLEPGLLGPKLKPLQERFDEMLKGQGLSPDLLTQRVCLLHAGKRRLKLKSFEQIAKATLDRKQIRIQHFNRQNGETLERVISPQQLVHYRDNWYVDAWCHLRKDVRSFAIDAIPECEVLKIDAKDLNPDQLHVVMQGGYGIFGGPVKSWAKLRFSPMRSRWVQREIWHPDQKWNVESDGSYTLEVPYSDERELLGDILRYGQDVEVLFPEELRTEIKKQLQLSLNRYGKNSS